MKGALATSQPYSSLPAPASDPAVRGLLDACSRTSHRTLSELIVSTSLPLFSPHWVDRTCAEGAASSLAWGSLFVQTPLWL